jgi:hypothetical protein
MLAATGVLYTCESSRMGGPSILSIPHSCYNAAVMGLTSFLFRLARLSADTRVLASGDPKKVARRGKNKALGRLLGRGKVWRRLWR